MSEVKVTIDNSLEFAIAVATAGHAGQPDKSGQPYILHPLRVMLALYAKGYRKEIVIAGVLHDVVEDTNITLQFINAKFGGLVTRIVDSVSQREGETHNDFVRRAAYDSFGRLVKIADVQDNSRPERQTPETVGLLKRNAKDLMILNPDADIPLSAYEEWAVKIGNARNSITRIVKGQGTDADFLFITTEMVKARPDYPLRNAAGPVE